jgi:hypothetical protein
MFSIMRRKQIIALIGIFVIAFSVYFFTDVFVSPSEKYMQELEYYEDLRYDTEEYKIQDYIDKMIEKWGNTDYDPDIIEVSKQEFREKLNQDYTYGATDNPRFWIIDFDYVPPNLSYDQTKLQFWVIAWDKEGDVIYWWSPR